MLTKRKRTAKALIADQYKWANERGREVSAQTKALLINILLLNK